MGTGIDFIRTVKDISFDDLEYQCKTLQRIEDHKLPSDAKYVLVHCDGRSFSKLIKTKFELPFDWKFSEMMDSTAAYVASKISGCVLAYVQSDEITFVIHRPNDNSELFFGGRLCKMQSIIASMCTAKFMQELFIRKIEGVDLINFDCKVWSVPSYDDIIQWLIFRQKDCVRNSKLQTAQTYLSHKSLHKLSAQECVEKLFVEKGISWSNDIDTCHKVGRMVYKIYVEDSNSWGTFTRSLWKSFPAIYFDDYFQLTEFENNYLNIIKNEL